VWGTVGQIGKNPRQILYWLFPLDIGECKSAASKIRRNSPPISESIKLNNKDDIEKPNQFLKLN
jgi:hypothetical protein